MRIRKKITFLLLTTSFLSITSLSIAFYYLTYDTLLKTHGQTMQALVTGKKSNIINVLNSWQNRVNLIIDRKKLQSLLSKEIASSSQSHIIQMKKILNEDLTSTVSIKSIKMCDLEGNNIVSVGTMLELERGCKDFLEPSLHNTSVRKLWMDKSSHPYSLVTGPIRLNGNLTGIIFVVFNAQEILNITENYEGLGKTGETLLVERTQNGDAHILMPFRYQQQDNLNHIVSAKNLNVPITQALLKREVVLTNSETVDYNGEPVIGATAYIPELDWGLVSKMSRQEALESVGALSLFNSILSVTLVICVVIILFDIYSSRLVTAPILNLADVSRKINDGNRTLIAETSSQDEIGELAASFNGMLDSLNKSSNELKDYAYRVSHDLRAPLRSSLGLVKLIDLSIQKEDKKVTFEALTLMNKSLTKLDRLVQDILLLARVEYEDEKSQPIDIDSLIKESLDKLSHMPHYERLDVQLNFGFKGKLSTKKNRLKVIVDNLISNAIKYQDLEEKNSFINISTYDSEKRFIFAVSDNGLGIPASKQEKLFTMFQRLHPHISFGSGLGLYMIKKSATILGGEINFEDTGQGSNFKFSVQV